MPDPSVQPPQGLREILIEKIAEKFAGGMLARDVGMWVVTTSGNGWTTARGITPTEAVDVVLAALFDACEVREEFGVETTMDDGTTDVSWLDRTREFAEGCVADHRRRGWLGSYVVRRCDLQTPPESVVPYPENVEGGG